MVRGREKSVAGIAASLVLLSAAANGQVSADNRLQAEIVVAVAQSLGADPAALPDYNEALKRARREADVTAVCGPQPKAQFLNEKMTEKVIAHALDILKRNNPAVSERPRYITDLIVTSAVSFEAGRLAGATAEYRAALCSASAPTAPAPQAPTPQ